MTYFPKRGYWIPLLLNAKSVDETTSPYLKILAPHLLWNMKQRLFWVNIVFNMLQYP